MAVRISDHFDQWNVSPILIQFCRTNCYFTFQPVVNLKKTAVSSLLEAGWSVLTIVIMICAERQNRKLLEQLEEQKKRLRMQTQQHNAGTAAAG